MTTELETETKIRAQIMMSQNDRRILYACVMGECVQCTASTVCARSKT